MTDSTLWLSLVPITLALVLAFMIGKYWDQEHTKAQNKRSTDCALIFFDAIKNSKTMPLAEKNEILDQVIKIMPRDLQKDIRQMEFQIDQWFDAQDSKNKKDV